MRGNVTRKQVKRYLIRFQRRAINNGLKNIVLHYNKVCNHADQEDKNYNRKRLVTAIVVLFLGVIICSNAVNSLLCTRCLLPSNFLVWEATRPLANCSYCNNINRPIILKNITRRDFVQYAYSSGPIILKNAIRHWRATKEFSFEMFKDLYEGTTDSYESLEDGCQFLNFKTNLFSLKEVFNMPHERTINAEGQEPWYVGWGNCHPEILSKVRKYYDVPDFLPVDAELPATENIFFGYEMGAVMHLDYISRLMWQGQVKGNKTWSVAPVPECEEECQKFTFYVEPKDIVIMDTRLWYHSTRIPKGEFSLTVQSEYG